MLYAFSSVPALAEGPNTADAASPSIEFKSIWVNAGMFSHHFDRSKNYREKNYGFGIEANLSEDNALYAGTFINSVDKHSNMLGWVWRPWTVGPVRVGLVAGVLDGYPRANNGGWFLGALPVASLEYRYFGVNFLILPDIGNKVDGAAVVQFKLRLK